MSRKRLSTNEMLHLSAEWLEPTSPAHQAIRNSAELAPTLPRIQSAHDELRNAAQPTALNPRLFEIIKEQTDLDDRHDDIIRGTFGLLSATAELLGPTDGAPFLELRNLLVPDGLSSVQKSYSDESGQAATLAARLTPEIRAQLDKILVGKKSTPHRLSSFVDEWIQIGQQLGSLDNEKARLQAPSPDTSTGASLISARHKWIRTTNLFLAIAEAAELDTPTHNLVFGPLNLLESKANRRGRLNPSTPEPDDDSKPSDSTHE